MPEEASQLSPQESSPFEYEVFYSLSALMLVNAAQALEAGETAFAKLHTLVGKMGTTGLSPAEANQIGLSNPIVEIDSVNLLSPREFYEIASIARTDLEQLGFDAASVSDAEMHRLARNMAKDYAGKLFWTSMKKYVEAMGVPVKPPDPAANLPANQE